MKLPFRSMSAEKEIATLLYCYAEYIDGETAACGGQVDVEMSV
jgi:hypothetical protein